MVRTWMISDDKDLLLEQVKAQKIHWLQDETGRKKQRLQMKYTF